MTHAEILNQPNAKVSRLLTLLKLENIRSSAKNKADVIQQSNDMTNPNDQLYKRWFDEIAAQADRAIADLNAASVEDV